MLTTRTPPQTADTIRASSAEASDASASRASAIAAVARLGPRGAAHRPVAEVRDHVLDADAAGDCHAVPAALAVVEQVVAGHAERHVGRGLVGELGLLHQQDVGGALGEPFLDSLHAGLERVDVPGRDAHSAPPMAFVPERRSADGRRRYDCRSTGRPPLVAAALLPGEVELGRVGDAHDRHRAGLDGVRDHQVRDVRHRCRPC